MNSFLERALDCVKRGWYVLPLVPRDKNPLSGLVRHGFKDASNDEAVIRRWWTAKPDANVGIACGKSGITVLDIDEGFQTLEDALAWMGRNGLPATYAVHTGRRFSKKDPATPEYGLQIYYAGAMPDMGSFLLDGCSGQIKSMGGLVMAEGNIHPDTGLAYEAAWEWAGGGYGALTPLPEIIRALKSADRGLSEPGQKIQEGAGRHDALMRVACGLRNRGLDGDAIYAAMQPVNDAMCEVPISDGELETMCYGIERRYPAGQPEPTVTLGQGKAEPKEPVDWRTRYMTDEQYRNVKPPDFLIDGFLVKGSIAMLGGPVAQRKSIIALNIAHALCTGDPLFGYFDVTEMPARTVYLCPEMGAASFVKRIKQIGLGQYVGKTLFIQTMNEHSTALDELDNELPGAVIIVDTITRFVEGDESRSDDMRKFAQKVFRLVNAGATVLLLHHSKKGSTGTLDDGLRGSSELAAFVDSCWITELEDTKRPYDSLSKMRNVKQRDFESDPFKLKPTPGEYYLTMEGDPEPEAVVASKKEAAARLALTAILHEHPQMGINKIREVLKAKGHGKGNKWVTARLAEMRDGGSVLKSD